MSWNILFLAFLYFLQGVPYGLQSRFLPLYFRTHGMSLSNIGLFKLLLVPWMLKALWAPLVDRYGTKKQWLGHSMLGLLLTSLLAALTSPAYVVQLAAVLMLFNILTSTQDIAVDGLAIQILATSELAAGNVAQVVGYKLGAVFSGGAVTWLSEALGISWGAIFVSFGMLYACAYLIIVFVVSDNNGIVSFIKSKHDENNMNKLKTNKSFSSGDSSDIRKLNRYERGAVRNSEEELGKVTQLYSNSDAETQNMGVVETHNKEKIVEGINTRTEKSGFYILSSQGWLIEHIREMISSPETKWVLAYVLIYKLGEQGSLSMLPLYLVDRGISPASVGFWTGVIGQSVSIVGSVLGGWLMSYYRYTPHQVVTALSWLRLVPLTVFMLLIGLWTKDLEYHLYVAMVIWMWVMLLGSGIITTATFTMMMFCSQKCRVEIQASHYTTLATAEVLGKLMFSVLIGPVTDALGYTTVFIGFVMLALSVLPVLWKCPRTLVAMGMDNKML